MKLSQLITELQEQFRIGGDREVVIAYVHPDNVTVAWPTTEIGTVDTPLVGKCISIAYRHRSK